MPFNTLARMEKGHLPDVANFARIVTWIGSDPAEFFRGPRPVRGASTVDAICDTLHADPLLPTAAAEQISGLVEQLYQSLVVVASPVVHVHVAPTLVPAAATLTRQLLDDLATRLNLMDTEPGWMS